MAKNYAELIRARLEQVGGTLATIAKGLIYYNTSNDRPYVDDGVSAREVMLNENLPEARRATKVQLDDTVTGNEIIGTLPYQKGGTGINTLTGEKGKALVVNKTEDGWEFGTSGQGVPSMFKILNAEEESVSDWTVSGTTAFTFDTTDVLNGDTTYKCVLNAINDSVTSPNITVPERSRERVCGLSFPFQCDVLGADIRVIDVTNGDAVLVTGTFVVNSTVTKNMELFWFMPSNTATIKIEIEAITFTGSQTIFFDDMVFDDHPVSNSDQAISETTPSVENFYVRKTGNFWDSFGGFVDEWDHSLLTPSIATSQYLDVQDVSGETRIIALENIELTVSTCGIVAAGAGVQIFDPSGNVTQEDDTSGLNEYCSATDKFILTPGQYIRIANTNPASGRDGSVTLTAKPILESNIIQNIVPTADLTENSMTARIQHNGGSPIVKAGSENVHWIDSASWDGDDYTINFVNGFFTQPPNIIAQSAANGDVRVPDEIVIATTSSVKIRWKNDAGVVNSLQEFTISASRTGSDYNEKEGFLLVAGDGQRNRFQTKTKNFVSSGQIDSFNNLDIGKVYRIHSVAYGQSNVGAGNKNFGYNLNHDGSKLNGDAVIGFVAGSDSDQRYSGGFSTVFKATATTLTADTQFFDNMASGDLVWTLEEVNGALETTAWT